MHTDSDVAVRGEIQSGNQLNQRRLTRTAATDDRDNHSLRDRQGKFVQSWLVTGGITERDLIKMQCTGDGEERRGPEVLSAFCRQ